MQSRRKFIGNTVAFSALFASNNLYAQHKEKNITILHTNDVHSRIEPFPLNDKNYAGMGGVAMRANIIQKIREQYSNILLLDAGDIFQGTPYFNFFKGSVEIDMMNQMQYDAATIGNHDFDGGIENLAHQISRANFPFVNCNYDFSQTILAHKIHQNLVIEKENIKIGITGCGVALDGLVPNNLCKGVVYHYPVLKVQEQVNILKYDKKCNLIILLSHLGYQYKDNKISDVVLAQETTDIDVIIGGHTHTFLTQPTIQKNKNNKDVIINQVGWAGLQVGQLNFSFQKITEKKLSKYHTVIVDKKTIVK